MVDEELEQEVAALRATLSRYRYATQWTAGDSWDFCSDCRERIRWAHAHDPERLSVNEVAAIGGQFLSRHSGAPQPTTAGDPQGDAWKFNSDALKNAGLQALDERKPFHEAMLKRGAALPIPMVLYCPACGVQHIDQPQPEKGWTNPPHRSHECQACGCIWRPADVATTGVEVIQTHGTADTWLRLPSCAVPAQPSSPDMEAARRDAGHFLRCESDEEIARLARGAPEKVTRIARALLASPVTAREDGVHDAAVEALKTLVDCQGAALVWADLIVARLAPNGEHWRFLEKYGAAISKVAALKRKEPGT